MTDVVPVKAVPVIVTLVPTDPFMGVKLVMPLTVKFAVLVPVPAGVVTLINPVVAPAGTVAVILIDEFTVKVAEAPLKVTAVAPVKFAPLMVMLVLTRPLVGVKLVIWGRGPTVKLLALVAVPVGVVTLMVPVVAPAGTVAVI